MDIGEYQYENPGFNLSVSLLRISESESDYEKSDAFRVDSESDDNDVVINPPQVVNNGKLVIHWCIHIMLCNLMFMLMFDIIILLLSCCIVYFSYMHVTLFDRAVANS